MTTYTYGGSSTGSQSSLSYTVSWGTDYSELMTGTGINDYIRAKNGNDVLVGGGGFDLLEGSGGGDRFKFDPGNGYDTVNNFNYSQGDRILLPSGITFSQLSFDYGVTAAGYLGGSNSGLNIMYQGAVWMRLEGNTSSVSTPFSINNFTYNSDIAAASSAWGGIV